MNSLSSPSRCRVRGISRSVLLKEQLREVEAKERASQLGKSDKTKFILSLKEPLI